LFEHFARSAKKIFKYTVRFEKTVRSAKTS